MMPETGAEFIGEGRAARRSGDARWSIGVYFLLFAGFAVIDLGVYREALDGAFVSDDFEYIVNNPFVNALTLENIVAVFDVSAAEKSWTGNYAPIDELLMALERHFFADRVAGYHVLNVLVHALNSVLLIALLRASRIAALGALLGGLVFALHPANVEAVAWMSQLKTEAALALSLGALLAFPRAPFASALLFAMGLLTKASALFALPTAAALTWARHGRAEGGARHWVWLGVWALLFALYALPEFASFSNFGRAQVPAYESGWVQLRSIAAIGARYLVMAGTTYGLSAFQQPEPVRSFLDPWWLAALPLAALLVWRIAATLRRRSEEAAYWIAAVAAYAPISQIFPFVFPIADRYLYFMLPGLIGGSLFLAGAARARLVARMESRGVAFASPGSLSRAAIVCALVLAAFFGARSAERAKVWRNETWLYLDAERHYPDGGPANLLRARRAAQRGDVEGAIESLRRAEERGYVQLMSLTNDRAFAPIMNTPDFHDFVRGMAGRLIERAYTWPQLNQAQYHLIAHAHMMRNEMAEAQAALESAIAAGGPQDAVLRAELYQLRLGSGRGSGAALHPAPPATAHD